MLGIYLTDEVDILTIAHDANGVETTTAQLAVKARVSERHKLVLDISGKEVVGTMQVLLEGSVAIAHDSRVKIKKINGVAYSMPDKPWQVKSISKGHGFGTGADFAEVWV